MTNRDELMRKLAEYGLIDTKDENLQKKFRERMDDYFNAFGECYPYAMGLGYPGKTTEENIKIIDECLKNKKPVDYKPNYKFGVMY